jgi:hypothetical protein
MPASTSDASSVALRRPFAVRLLSLPFDAMRYQYAQAVSFGVVQRSSLASARLERGLDVLERLILGPMARRR